MLRSLAVKTVTNLRLVYLCRFRSSLHNSARSLLVTSLLVVTVTRVWSLVSSL
ncbi:hypothetical protein D3C85_1941420 [compost metagenome]